MTEQEYSEAAREATDAAGKNDGCWNTRFVGELYKRNLRLVPIRQQKLELGYYVQAPVPVEHELPTWTWAVIVPIEQ